MLRTVSKFESPVTGSSMRRVSSTPAPRKRSSISARRKSSYRGEAPPEISSPAETPILEDPVDEKSPIDPPSTGSDFSQTKADDGDGATITRLDTRASRRNAHLHKFRHSIEDEDNDQEDWWFASTAIPLIAATVGPLANVLSIGALVTYWRMNLIPNDGPFTSWDGNASSLVSELQGFPFADPRWCFDLNILSLVCGFLGNLFLLANFTNRIRYIIALPATIIFWYISTALLMGITISMNIYAPPNRPTQTYTQGFWYGVIAAVLYLVCSMILMINMLGYFLGHYPQHFNLTDAQRTLILQTMLFFIWLAGGAAVFANTQSGNQGWLFTDGLYFCDVTILTVGFGDLYPENDLGRGLVFPYAVGGIIMLGLMISSIGGFTGEIGQENVIKKRMNSQRLRTIERSQTASLARRFSIGRRRSSTATISEPFSRQPMSKPLGDVTNDVEEIQPSSGHHSLAKTIHRSGTLVFQAAHGNMKHPRKKAKKSRAVILQEEKDRFDAMRAIQHSNSSFKKWTALTISVIAFGIVWCVGAVAFWQTERDTLDMTYFQALYFCYVSLLTIGYGDLAPKSNAGRPFFVVWSLLAVPTMTILVTDLGETVINRFKNGTNQLADFTVLPKYGIWRSFLERHPWLLGRLTAWRDRREAEKRLEAGFQVGPDQESGEGIDNSNEDGDEEDQPIRRYRAPSLAQLAAEEKQPPTQQELAKRLALAIRKVATDFKQDLNKKYGYEEWVEFTELIKFSSRKDHDRSIAIVAEEEEDEELVEWDWIGETSPMMAGKGEPEFVLDRLCESMSRYVRRNVMEANRPLAVVEEDSDSSKTTAADEVLAAAPPNENETR